MMRRFIILCAFIGLALLAFSPWAAAQQSASQCPAFVEATFTAAASNCAIPERSSTCYGSPLVSATNLGGVPTPSFSKPSDRAELLGLESVSASAFNLAAQTWGLALTNIQANLPVGLQGPGGVFASIGDVRLENGVMPQQALRLPVNPLVVTTVAQNAELYNAPPGFGVESKVVASAPAGTLLQADGASADQQWVRVYYEYETELAMRADAWIAAASITPGIDLRSLPVIGPDSLTPMQKFYLSNGHDDPACAEALPSFLYVQGPEEIELDFVVNGAAVRVSSSAFIRMLPGSLMEVIALTGLVVLSPGTPDEQLLAPGFFSTICMASEPQNLGVDGQANDWTVGPNCRWTPPAEVPDALLTRLYNNFHNRLSRNLMYYQSGVPRRICVSGVGGPVCIIVPPLFEQRERRLCRLRLLERPVCQAFGMPWGR